jgi:hypothetical protein
MEPNSNIKDDSYIYIPSPFINYCPDDSNVNIERRPSIHEENLRDSHISKRPSSSSLRRSKSETKLETSCNDVYIPLNIVNLTNRGRDPYRRGLLLR